MKTKIKAAQAAYMLALANLETIKQMDAETRAEVLLNSKFYNEDTGERLTDPRIDYLMPESDLEPYAKKCYEVNKGKGIAGNDWNACITYPAQESLKQAENVIMDLTIENLYNANAFEAAGAIKANRSNWKYRQQAIDLFMKLNAETVGQ